MRNAFFEGLEDIYAEREDIFILTGDLGFKLFDQIKSRDPRRFYDIGVAESNMIGIAAGLALTGKTVYCYSIIPFLTMRAYEQIRMDIAYHNANVRLVGYGAGFTYGLEGYSHFGLEDLALMKALPNMTIMIPADADEAKVMAKTSAEHVGPMYIRLERARSSIPSENNRIDNMGKALPLRTGHDVALIAIGNMVQIGCQVADMLSAGGKSASVYNVRTIKPFDKDTVLKVAADHPYICTFEEHSVSGGLGSSVAELLLENGYRGRFKRFGIPEKMDDIVGTAEYLRNHYGLTAERIYDMIIKDLE